MADSPDSNLQLKKRARRRLLGAIAFAGLAAVVLPMMMDEEPKQQIQDVQIRIPGQEQTPFEAKLPPVVKQEPEPASGRAEAKPVAAASAVAPADSNNAAERASGNKAEKSVEKVPEKAAERPAKTKMDEPQRAAAILSGKTVEPAAAGTAEDGQFVILIGAFSNPANVKQLEAKMGEVGVKVYTEPLDSPEGKKTRVRAGPFASRDAADKALDKLKKIGVNGTVAAK